MPFGSPSMSRSTQRGSAKGRLQIALLIETSNAYARGLLEGITLYLRDHQSWSIYISEHRRGDSVPHWLWGWNGDGIIARIENRDIARAVAERNLPTVDVSAARLLPGVPWVETDDAAIARLAFDHLADRGFRHLGFCGLNNYNWSLWRCDHFRRLAAEAGCDCSVHMTETGGDRAADWAAEQDDLATWIQGLPKPVGVFACFDIRGRQVLDACRMLGVRVPDEVAVIGVDNDPVLCELADPPLSSVIPDTHRTGYVAADLLARMIAGERVQPEAHLIQPRVVIARRSTDALAIDDPDVSAAVAFIREHACDGIGVKQVLDAVALSRRVLESRFKKLLGRTPHAEIVRVQVARARDLLTQTDLPLKTIARRVGIAHAEYLSVVFKSVAGKSPSAYRREQRLNSLKALSARLQPFHADPTVRPDSGKKA
jgi:LacI family transcriptional regulator